jgi:hypothetical protein
MEILVRFNNNFNSLAKKGSKESLKWRMLINGVEHLVDEVEINCPCKTETSYVEMVGVKHHIKVEVDSFEIVGKITPFGNEVIIAVLSNKLKSSGNLGFDYAVARQEYIQKEYEYEQSKINKVKEPNINDNQVLTYFYKKFKNREQNFKNREQNKEAETLPLPKPTKEELYKAELERRKNKNKVEGEVEKPHWNTGRKHTEETLAKMRKPKAKKGIRRKKSKQPNGNKGKIRSEETIAKMRKPKSVEHILAMKKSWEKRKRAKARKLNLLLQKIENETKGS